MKKPSTEDRIMEAALELFVRNGFHGTSIDNIMSKVQLTKGAFYSHFTGKNDLFMRLVDQYRQQFIGGITATIEQSEGNALDKLHRVITFLSRFAAEHTNMCVFLTFLTSELNSDTDFEAALKQIYRDYQKLISGLVRQGKLQRLFKQELDADLVAMTFMALHDGVLHQWTLHRQYIDSEQFVRTFREIFLGGLCAAGQAGAVGSNAVRVEAAG